VELCQLGRTVRRRCGPPGPLWPQIGASKDLNAAARRRQQGGSITTKCLLRRLVATDRCHRPGAEFCTKSPLRHQGKSAAQQHRASLGLAGVSEKSANSRVSLSGPWRGRRSGAKMARGTRRSCYPRGPLVAQRRGLVRSASSLTRDYSAASGDFPVRGYFRLLRGWLFCWLEKLRIRLSRVYGAVPPGDLGGGCGCRGGTVREVRGRRRCWGG